MRNIPHLHGGARPKRVGGVIACLCVMGMMPLFAVVPDDARPFPTGATNRVLTAVEYFVDTDPGAGSGTAIIQDVAYDEATESIATLSISGSSIPNGSRRIGVRARDELGNWSPVTYLDVSVVDVALVEGQPYNVPQVDHLALPQLPSVGSVVKVTLAGATYSYQVKQGDNLTAVRAGLKSALVGNPTATATVLSDGRIKLTSLNAGNAYAVTLSAPGGIVQKTRENDFPKGVAGLANRFLTAVEYFVDTDPGSGKGTAINSEDVAYDEATESIATLSISPSAIPNGSRVLVCVPGMSWVIGPRPLILTCRWWISHWLRGNPTMYHRWIIWQSPSCPPWGALSK